MTEHHRSAWSIVRLIAAVALAVAAFAFANPLPLAAGGGGTCAPATGTKCISSSGNVYDEKMCVGTQCVSCQPRNDNICTGFGEDVEDHYDSGGEN